MHMKKRVFVILAVQMIGFGILIGVVFPFFVILMGVPSDYALNIVFVSLCVLAGIIVGFVNILITKITVGKRMNILTQRMIQAKNHILKIAIGDTESTCTPENCLIPVDSDDAFGKSAQAFNQLISSFSASLSTQATLRMYSEVLSSQLDLAMLGKNALNLLITHAGATAGAIIVETEGELKIIASNAIRNVQTLAESGLVLNAFKGLKQLQITLPEDVLVENILTDFRPKDMIIEPIKYKGVPLGLIVLASSGNFTSNLKNELDIFAYGLALALNNALEHDQLQKLAALDPLTGSLNRRFGLQRLHEEFARTVRSNISIGLAMFDIDHFKKVNDTYGHVAGDRVLTNIARIVRMGLREGDMLVRFGGEEFLLILPGASREDAFKITERLRYIVRESQVAYGDAKINVTVSIGCDSFPESNVESEQALIIRVDEAMYRAKESGRDKVILY